MNAHERGGLWLLQEMWGFPAGVPEDQRLDYLKLILVCARGKGELTSGEKDWVIGYGAACGAHQETVDALEAYDADEDIDDILSRNMPTAETWGRVAIFDAIRAASADNNYGEDERKAVRRVARAMKISDEIIDDLEAVHHDEQELKGRRIALVFGQEPPYQDRG